MSNNVGPVCHIPPASTTANPQPSAIPGVGPPAQPNLQSLTNTVNNLRQLLLALLGQQGSQGPAGANGSNAPSAGSFTQKDIATEKVKIYQNNDPSTGNFVEVERINKLVLGTKTGNNTWTYNRG